MPDLISVFTRSWKFLLGFSLFAAIVALVITLILPKEYKAVATALPANSMTADKGRIFNTNIQELYSDIGTPDELDRIEGTAALDTIYVATANQFKLEDHYGIPNSGESFYKAAMKLKKKTRISRSAYGELKVRVWDKDRNLSAALANSLLQNIQSIHQKLQAETNAVILARLREEYERKKSQYISISDSLQNISGAEGEIAAARKTTLLEQVRQYGEMVDQYQLALNTNPPALLTVEKATPPVFSDRPKILQTVLLTLFAAFVVSFLVSLFIQGRNS